jgi:geranylgeranyl diphosphate synthase type II
MVHAYSLIHDDLPAMDDDDLRRGRPTCHKKFGEATAILAGDALLALAFETLAGLSSRAEVVARCCATLAEAAGPCQLVGGQADDIAGGLDSHNISTDDDSGPGGRLGTKRRLEKLESIHRRKTGALILASLRLGSLVAGADSAAAGALEQYGRRLGLAFQITDDLLDARGDEAAMGKRVGKDAGLGKLTFPGLLGIDESQRLAERLIGEARDSLSPLPGPAEGLSLLAQYVLERNS